MSNLSKCTVAANTSCQWKAYQGDHLLFYSPTRPFWYDNDKDTQTHSNLTELPSLPTIRFDHTSLEVSFGSAVSVSLSLVLLLLLLPALSLLDSIVEYSWIFYLESYSKDINCFFQVLHLGYFSWIYFLGIHLRVS